MATRARRQQGASTASQRRDGKRICRIKVGDTSSGSLRKPANSADTEAKTNLKDLHGQIIR